MQEAKQNALARIRAEVCMQLERKFGTASVWADDGTDATPMCVLKREYAERYPGDTLERWYQTTFLGAGLLFQLDAGNRSAPIRNYSRVLWFLCEIGFEGIEDERIAAHLAVLMKK